MPCMTLTDRIPVANQRTCMNSQSTSQNPNWLSTMISQCVDLNPSGMLSCVVVCLGRERCREWWSLCTSDAEPPQITRSASDGGRGASGGLPPPRHKQHWICYIRLGLLRVACLPTLADEFKNTSDTCAECLTSPRV